MANYLGWEEAGKIMKKMIKVALNHLPRNHGLDIAIVFRSRATNTQIVGGSVPVDGMSDFLLEVIECAKTQPLAHASKTRVERDGEN